MYEIIETAILTGGYDLQAMASKIDGMYAADRLTADEWQKLRKLCLDHLRPEDTRPELQQQLEYLAARVTALEAQVAALTAGVSARRKTMRTGCSLWLASPTSTSRGLSCGTMASCGSPPTTARTYGSLAQLARRHCGRSTRRRSEGGLACLK